MFDCGGEGSCYSCLGLKVWDEDLHELLGLPCYYNIKPTLNSRSTEAKQSKSTYLMEAESVFVRRQITLEITEVSSVCTDL